MMLLYCNFLLNGPLQAVPCGFGRAALNRLELRTQVGRAADS